MKRTISMLISFIMLMVICVPFKSSALGSTDLYEKYTFEEFIKLSEDEVCAISDEIAEEYKQYKDEVYERYSYYENKGYKLTVPVTHMEVTKEFWDEIETYFNEHGALEGDEYTESRFFVPSDVRYLNSSVNLYTILGNGDTIHYVILLDML